MKTCLLLAVLLLPACAQEPDPIDNQVAGAANAAYYLPASTGTAGGGGSCPGGAIASACQSDIATLLRANFSSLSSSCKRTLILNYAGSQ